ncbi:hypothetical protein [Streptomyces sp. NPDC059169]|uniref:hypothetical protein n=1 Tax=unclassified Streptomyces TaxID=2593676 RepID=UPI00369FA5D8
MEPVCFQVFHEKVSARVKVWPEYEQAGAMARRFNGRHPNVQVILTVHEFCQRRGLGSQPGGPAPGLPVGQGLARGAARRWVLRAALRSPDGRAWP